jgi:hypothetical protein
LFVLRVFLGPALKHLCSSDTHTRPILVAGRPALARLPSNSNGFRAASDSFWPGGRICLSTLRSVFASVCSDHAIFVKGAMTTTKNNIDKPNWQAESLRLSIFLSPSIEFKGADSWKSTIGSEPESRTVRPARGELVEAGSYLGNTLTLSVQPGRVDWLLTPSQTQLEDAEATLKTVGQFPDIVNTFGQVMSKWLEDCPPAIRLAYGAVLFERVENKEAGYGRLPRYLTAIEIDVSSEDFFYQINRPRMLKGTKDAIKINRLSKWSVATIQPVRMAFSIVGQSVSAPAVMYTPPDSIAYACRLELDISTPAQLANELPRNDISVIFAELISLGSEIASRGDIP